MRGAVRWLACVALIVCAQAGAQSFDLAAQPGAYADLSKAEWRFHTGDDARWAEAGFDDSQWALLRGDKSWDDQGYPHYSGYAWYRIRVKVQPGRALSIAPGHLFDSYEVYADGQEIGHWGPMVANGFPLSGHGAWTLLAQAPQHSGEIVFAIRVWHYPRWAGFYGGGFWNTPAILGDSVAVGSWVALQKDEAFLRAAPLNLTALLSLLAGLGTLLLYAKDRTSKEYLWFGVMEAAYGLTGLWLMCVGFLFALGIDRRNFVTAPLSATVLVASILFLFRFVDRPVTRWARWFLFAQIPYFLLAMATHAGRVLSNGQMSTIQTLNMLLWYGTLLWVVFRFWKHSRGARLLAVPLLLLEVAIFVPGVYGLLYRVGWTTWRTPLVPISNFEFVYAWVAQLIFLAAVAYFLVERFAETQAERTRLQDEFEAARTVQSFLLGREASAQGYTVESAYLPAQEVGGDFFQTIAGPEGSLLAVIGDVAGKGLQAAMRVSMLIGVVRTSPEYSPAALLRKLNAVLLQDGSSGFTTCLVVRLDADGTVTIANAGHLSPYINGRELTIDGGLPLGVADGVDYSEQRFPFAAGDVMLLMSDGVVEARSASGELFGFERMAQTASSVTGAGALAETAQAFGQDDDITVLLLQRAMAPAV
ncbi:MAG: PP2C family protein-serine/threonine phosphatase [Acidobacteriaceae bacterium]|jgi:hypothetical protein